MIKINLTLKPSDLADKLKRFWELSGEKINLIENNYDILKGSPVFTSDGKYITRGWTEWTQGFLYGSMILQYDATGEKAFLEMGRRKTIEVMAPHVSHTGVHDHGFNNVSTYGNLLRLMKEGKIAFNEWEKDFYSLALKISGAIQARRWTIIKDGGFIYSFNGPHSLFVDTLRSCRSLILSHCLGHTLQSEGDQQISLLERAVEHMKATAKYSIFYGEGRDIYDVLGRTAHESIFNINDGNFRCPNSQQGYSGFSTWTRGLAWAMCGFAEEIEWFDSVKDAHINGLDVKKDILPFMIKAAGAVCDFYIDNCPVDGVPYWDTGAPNLYKAGDYLNKPADPFNDFEPIDSSAAPIAAQGLLRLGRYLQQNAEKESGDRYWQAGLTVLNTIFAEPYLSTGKMHQGLLLHSVYHRPNGWDYIAPGSKIPNGESGMWGDYHFREAALYIQRVINNETYHSFFQHPMNSTDDKDISRLCIHTITTKPWEIEEAAQHFSEAGVKAITVWRDALEGKNIKQTGEILLDHDLTIVSLCRGGFFPAKDLNKRKSAIDDNRRAIDEAAQLGAPMLVLVCGADPSQRLEDSRKQIQDGIGELIAHASTSGIKLAIEPLHPMYADTRSAINTMKQANDMAEELNSPWVGVAVDVYHVWWDPFLEKEIRRCGENGHLMAFHICDWKVPTADMLLDRGLMGEGCIPVKQIRSWVEAAGFTGYNEVEIFSTTHWKENQSEYLRKIIKAYKENS